MPQNRTLSKARRNLLRGGVWALFGLLLAGGFSVANVGVAEAPQEATAARVAYSGGPAVQSVPGLVSAADEDAPEEICNEACLTLASRYQGHEIDLLPAYRWKQANSMTNTYGWKDGGNVFFSAIAQLLFMFAGFVWWLLLELIRLALQLDPLFSNSVGKEVNNLFYGISSGVSAGFVWFACVATVLVAMITPLRSKGAPSIMSVVVMVMLPLGTLWAMTTAADPTKDVIGVGSPVWFGRQGVMMIDQTTGFASDVMSDAMGATKMKSIQGAGAGGSGPSCTAYNGALKNAFQAAWATDAARPNEDAAAKKTVLDSPVTPDPVSNLRGAQHTGAGTMVSLSNLWESAYVPQYVAAEFGGEKAGWDIYCHYMERDTGTSAAEQATIGAAAVGYPATPNVTKLGPVAISETRVIPVGDRVNPNSDGSGTPAPATQEAGDTWPEAGPYIGTDPTWSAKEKKEQAQLMLWAACKNSGDVFTAKKGWAEYGELTDNQCSDWWSSGKIIDNLQWDEGTARDNKWTPCSSKDGDCASEVSQMYLAMHGKNAGQRVFAGAFSLATAAAYMYVFGMVGLGVLIAKVGLLLMLMALPVTLFLLALPKWRVDPKTAQRNATGMKLMRKTFGFAAATAVFQLVVVFAVLIIALIRSVLFTFTGGLGGTVDMIAPLLALFLMTKLMKQLGLGNLTRPSGALGLAAAAAAGAGAEKGKGFGAMKNRAAKNKGVADKGIGGRFQENKGEEKAREALANAKAKKSGKFNPEALAALSAGGLAERTAAAAKAMDEAKTPKQKADAKAKLDNALKEGAARDKKALDAIGKSEDAAAGAVTDGQRAIKESNVKGAMADATRRGLGAGDALANESMKSDGNKALDKAAAEISAASGGAVSTADARASLESGHKMGAFVQKADGSVVSAAEALSSGHASLSASGVMTGAAGATVMTARGAAAMGALARTHDASYSVAGSQAQAANTSMTLGAATGGCNVAPVRGTGGMVVPANSASGFAGSAACGGAEKQLMDSRAGLPMALSASTSSALMQAAGGDSTRAAALYQEAMTMRGCETSSLSGVLGQSSAGQDLMAALSSTTSSAAADSAWQTYRNSGSAISLSDDEISHCISAAESRHQSDMQTECATFSEPVRSAGAAAQASIVAARAEMYKDAPDAAAVSRHMADAAGFLAVAEQGQQDLNNFISSNGSRLPSGGTVDVGAATAQAAASVNAALVGASTGGAFRARLKDDLAAMQSRVQNVGDVATAPRSYSRSNAAPRHPRPVPVLVP